MVGQRGRGREGNSDGAVRAPFIPRRQPQAVSLPRPPADHAAAFDAFFGGRLHMTSVYKPLLLRALLDATAAAGGRRIPGAE